MPKRREQRSLFGEILDWMLAPLLLLWPMSVMLTWVVAQGIANRAFDRDLAEVARILARQVTLQASAETGPKLGFALPVGAAEILRADVDEEVYYQVLGLHGEVLSGEPGLPVPAEPVPAPAGEMRFRDDVVDQRSVRVAYVRVELADHRDGPGPLVQVAETPVRRSQLATEIIKGVILPQFLILPLAVLLVWMALSRGIAPLNALQQRIRWRESHDLSPIDEHDAPEEVAPLVQAINDLLARLDHSIGAQKHFLADAAHQLKTPLAGLRTQAELAQREIDAGASDARAVKRSLQQIARSSERAAHMVNQLLAMARAEDSGQALQQQPVNLARLAMETVHDFVPRALERRIDLGYEGPEHTIAHRRAQGLAVHGHPLLLRELIRNLVDNALQYTPPGGTVTVRVIEDPFGQVVVLQVEDSGPGIAPAERGKVFQPFYRVLGSEADGSGLGLAIVREIAQQHGTEVTLEDADPRARMAPPGTPGAGPGARFTLRMAVQAPPAAGAHAR